MTPRPCTHRRQRVIVRHSGARVQVCRGCGRVLATVAAAPRSARRTNASTSGESAAPERRTEADLQRAASR